MGFLIGILLVINHNILGQNHNKDKTESPNIIVIFCDDMGYGDLSCYGHPTIETPNLDKMAEEGQKWTSFYVAASVCTPSRAGILTGRYPIRSGMTSNKHAVIFPESKGGLPASEITLAELLSDAGYSTACIGKWHLGHLYQFMPLQNGFDYFFGLPYSNDMDRVQGTDYYTSCIDPKTDLFQVPLMRNDEIIEKPANQHTLTKRYTEETVRFIKNNKDSPFFIYLAHNMPHVPLFRSKDFVGKSKRGKYGDVTEEIDWSVGQILEVLKDSDLDKKTLVVFTSDNGPWLMFKEHGGSAGLLSEGKGSSYEGGFRVPAIFWWKGKIKPGIVSDMGSTLDLLPTICRLTGIQTPEDRMIDGVDLSQTLLKEKESPRNVMVYYRGEDIYAIRKGDFKAHFLTKVPYSNSKLKKHDPPLLFNVSVDPSEKYNIADKHPQIIEQLINELEKHKKTVVPVENQLEKR